MIVDVVEGIICNVSVRDHYGLHQSILLRFLTNINDVFSPDRRLVVGKAQSIHSRTSMPATGNTPRAEHAASPNLNADPRDFEMSQFWQKRQPHVATRRAHAEHARVPGRKWFSGFFSIGSNLAMRPENRIPDCREFATLIDSNEAKPAPGRDECGSGANTSRQCTRPAGSASHQRVFVIKNLSFGGSSTLPWILLLRQYYTAGRSDSVPDFWRRQDLWKR